MSLNALAKLTRSRKRPRPHISAALPAHTIVSCYSLPSEQREGRGEQLAVTLVPRISIWAMLQLKLDEHNVSNKQQLQKPTTEQVLTFTLNSGLICHFWETGRLISSRV